MDLPTTASVITPRQKFKGHTDSVCGVIHLPGAQRIITCSHDGSLRVWNLKNGRQIGKNWRDGGNAVQSIALSPDGKKMASGSWDGAVRLWDIDTCKVIAKWTGHTKEVVSVCWSRDGQRVLSGSNDGTARQWDVESGETIPKPIENGHERVWAVVYSPDMTLIATSGLDELWTAKLTECSVKIWDAETSKLIATLKGHTDAVACLAWTKDGKTLISGSFDCSIRTWNTTKWEQTAVLKEHTNWVFAIAISPDDRILASASWDKTARLWNLDDDKPISSPLQHARVVSWVSFSADGKQLVTGCWDKNAYSWDVAMIVKEAGLDDLLSDSKVNKPALHSDATRRPVHRHPPAYRLPQGFFDGVPPDHHSQFYARSCRQSSETQGTTLLRCLFHHSTHESLLSSPLDWARNVLKWCRQSDEGTELQGRSPAVVEFPYAKGKRRNACAREQRKTPLLAKNLTASSSRPSKPNATQQSATATQSQPSSQPQAAASNLSTTPAVGDNTAATSSTPSRPDLMLRQAGLWTRFWLFIGCLSPEYQDGRQ